MNIKTPKEFVDILTRGKAGQKYAVVLERK